MDLIFAIGYEVVMFIDVIGDTLAQLLGRVIPSSVAGELIFLLHVAGHPITITVVLGGICLIELFRHKDRIAVLYVAAVAATWMIVRALKYLIGRERPALSDSVLVFATSSAFPSGHAAMAMAAYGYLIWLLYKEPVRISARGRRLRERSKVWNITKHACAALLGILIVLIGFSRVYERVHWFSDIVAGWIVGAIVLAIVIALSHIREIHRN